MTKQYLADIKRKLYDPREFKNFKQAVQMNLVVQINSGNAYIVPLVKKQLQKLKYKKGKLF